MGLLKFFGKRALTSFKRSIDDLQETLNEIDVENIESRFSELRSDLNSEFEKLINQFKKVGNKLIVEVPYDRDTQTLSYKLEDGVMTVTVETCEETENGSFKSKSVTTRTIPEGVNVDEMKHKYLDKEKKMLFIFKNSNKVEVVEENASKTDDFEPIGENEVKDEEPIKLSKEEMLKKMVHMHLNGCSYRKIAEECGVSDKTAKRWIGAWLTEHDAEGCA